MLLPIRKTVKYDELGLVFKNGRFIKLVGEGKHWLFDFQNVLRVDVLNQRDPWIRSTELDQLSKSELLEDKAVFVDLKDNERAFVWVDGRLDSVLGPGLYGLWNQLRKVEIERFDANDLKLVRKDLVSVLKNLSALQLFEVVEVPEGKVGVLFVDGAYRETLPAGKHAFWKNVAKVKIQLVEKREQVLDVSGQDIMTRDKVTLRLNAVLAYRVVDERKSVEASQDASQALYRETQLALRSEVGVRDLDTLLSGKEDLAQNAKEYVAKVANDFGLEVVSLGVRDVILPGDMKNLMNQVIEAQKASEANVIKRREETAAMRSQLNTAKLMESNPVLMRLRELEVLESVSKTANLQVVLGEKGLAESLTKLI
ncbi:slipin family protein [Pelagicoccus mobilis]|uniref:Slipin family protein n=1 Tax=Pelagicoccus mobilis TaxID=415221 RepID=A0A934RYU0_9BACT|nr:slipin family protein [Pelagicoccus mobilis]MBK1877366.1 slipin family protein [Pelagicoccus mobilis]